MQVKSTSTHYEEDIHKNKSLSSSQAEIRQKKKNLQLVQHFIVGLQLCFHTGRVAQFAVQVQINRGLKDKDQHMYIKKS